MKRILVALLIACIAFFAGTQYALRSCTVRANDQLATVELFGRLHLHDNMYGLDVRDTMGVR